MNQPSDLTLSSAVGSQLDQSLQQWAAHYRLTPLQVETLLRAIHSTPDDLVDEWGRDFWARIAHVIQRATSMPHPLQSTP